MNYIYNSMSIELYILILALAIFAAFYEMYNMKRKKSGDPTIWIFPFMILTCVAFIIKRCAMELTTNIIFQKAANIGATICAIMLFIVFIVTYIVAYKNNYINTEKIKKLKPLFIACFLIIIICSIYGLYYKFF